MNSRKTLAVISILVIAAVFLVAVGVESITFSPGFRVLVDEAQTEPVEGGTRDLEAVGEGYRLIVRIFVFLAGAIVVVAMFVKPLRRSLIKSAILIGVMLIVLSLINPRYPDQEPEPEETESAANDLPPIGAEARPEVDPDEVITDEISPAVTFFVSLLVVGLAGSMVVALVRAARRRRPRPGVRELIADEAERTLSALESPSISYPDAITECYAMMQRIVRESHGVARRPAMTPREFIDSVSSVGVPRDSVETLTELFEAVRYGERTPTGFAVTRARSALNTIVAECRSRQEVPS